MPEGVKDVVVPAVLCLGYPGESFQIAETFGQSPLQFLLYPEQVPALVPLLALFGLYQIRIQFRNAIGQIQIEVVPFVLLH